MSVITGVSNTQLQLNFITENDIANWKCTLRSVNKRLTIELLSYIMDMEGCISRLKTDYVFDDNDNHVILGSFG